MLKLIAPNTEHLNKILDIYLSSDGNKMNDALSNLFVFFNNKDKHEILIKAVAINQIYSTAILNIYPVVDKIFTNTEIDQRVSINYYIKLVDKIAEINWIAKNGKNKRRCNLSFSSKYVHFLSNKAIPIYDSYVWILITGYLNQNSQTKIRTNEPKNYSEFYIIYKEFVNLFNLNTLNVYKIDKFLWQYCYILLDNISKENNITINKSKPILKKLIKEGE
ncbi:MAG: hypothetical protein WBP33_04635 [Saprospiraceae bacterium]|nr:hypothetical protein [Candidatus Vicinibacter proximus]